jgi:hypothetical protein
MVHIHSTIIQGIENAKIAGWSSIQHSLTT